MILSCNVDPSTIICTTKVDRKLKCEHTASLDCYVSPSTYICRKSVNFKCKCNHNYQMDCNLIKDFNCTNIRSKNLNCGHTIEVKCFEYDSNTYCYNNVNITYKELVEKYLKNNIDYYLLHQEYYCNHMYGIKCSDLSSIKYTDNNIINKYSNIVNNHICMIIVRDNMKLECKHPKSDIECYRQNSKYLCKYLVEVCPHKKIEC